MLEEVLGPAQPDHHGLGQGEPRRDQNLAAPTTIAVWVQVKTKLGDHETTFGSAICSPGGNRGCICTDLKAQTTS